MKKAVSLFSILPVFLFVLLFAGLMQRSAEGSPSFAGVDTCKGCHDGYYDSYAKTVHSKKAVFNSPASRQACESCHGAGSAHVEKGGGRGTGIVPFTKKSDAGRYNEICLSCHEETRHLALWSKSRHKDEGVSCVDCHSLHGGRDYLLKSDKSEVCFACHRDIRTMVNKQSHHPVREGKVSCVDCHNPHGTMSDKMIKTNSINELCYKCHAEKRGPYMQEHPPVDENCLNCHNPHGSNHNRLLTMRVPELCEECHNGPGFHAGQPINSFSNPALGAQAFNSSRLAGRSCLNCHNNIHGGIGVSGRNSMLFIH